MPFIFGALLTGVFLVYYSRNVKESPLWETSTKRENPLKTVVFGRFRRNFWQVFIFMAGVWFASNMASGRLPSSLASQTTLTPTQITGIFVVAQYLCERFPSSVRGSGFGLGYSMPLLVTAGYAYYQDWLSHLMPLAYTPVGLLVLGGILITVGALIGRETKDVDLTADPRPGRSRGRSRSRCRPVRWSALAPKVNEPETVGRPRSSKGNL